MPTFELSNYPKPIYTKSHHKTSHNKRELRYSRRIILNCNWKSNFKSYHFLKCNCMTSFQIYTSTWNTRILDGKPRLFPACSFPAQILHTCWCSPAVCRSRLPSGPRASANNTSASVIQWERSLRSQWNCLHASIALSKQLCENKALKNYPNHFSEKATTPTPVRRNFPCAAARLAHSLGKRDPVLMAS